MIKFSVYGIPKPQGDVRAFKNIIVAGGTKEQRIGLASWRTMVGDALRAALATNEPFPDGTAIGVRLTFYVVRPKSRPIHKFPYPVTKPDADKLIRATGDAMTKVLYRDDSQICAWYVRKLYADTRTPGLDAEAWAL